MIEVNELSLLGKIALGGTLFLFVGGLALVGRFASRGVETEAEYLVANRQVPLWLSVLALLATWFGSSSVIESSSKMYRGGIGEVLLDPIACGLTLIFTGCFFAERFWKTQAATVADLFRQQFGPTAERLSCAIQVPSFFLWIGAQFLAMGQLIESALGLPLGLSILLSAAVAWAIVVGGGMWAVTWANSIMILVSLLSMLVLFGATAYGIGQGDAVAGWSRVIDAAPKDHFRIDAASYEKCLAILSVLLIGLLGNVPGQDLQQRVASAKSAATARWMCVVGGVLYLLIGLIPLYLGLAARWTFGDGLSESQLPLNAIAARYLSEPFQILLIVGMFSLCLAVAASATLSQASIVSRNVIKPLRGLVRDSAGSESLGDAGVCDAGVGDAGVWGARFSVGLVIAGSLAVAYSGESIMELLELSLVLVLVSLFVPMAIALYAPSKQARPGVGNSAMIAGFVAWLVGFTFESRIGIPASLIGLSASAIAAWLAMRSDGWSARRSTVKR
ncbi:MAG: sodium:solute symporter family transporter [Pirellula sp.]